MTTIRAVSYSRFSSNNQRTESIDAQQRAIYKYISENQYMPVGDYVDEALTGTNLHRPGFQKMLDDAQKGLFDVVIVHKMDRFSRDVFDALSVQRELEKYNVKIESVIERFEDTPEGNLSKFIQLGIGQYYSQNLAREVVKGLKENAYKAMHNGGIPPYGFDVDPETKRYIINEHEASGIRIMFEKIVQGWSYRELAEYLNLLGYRTKIGNKFSANSSFYDLLTNPKYKGEYVFNRSVSKPKQIGMKRSHRKNKNEEEIIRIPNGVPAIVDEETFELVQKLLKQRRRSKGQHKAKEVYLLTGLVECAECGSTYHGSSRIGGRNKSKYVSYRCSKRKKLENPCKCKEINKALLDEFVVNQLYKTLLNQTNLEQLLEEVNVKLKQKYADMDHDLPQLQKQLDEVNQKISNLVQAIAMGGLGSLDTITQEIQRLEYDKVKLTELIQENQVKKESLTLTLEQLKQVLDESKQYMLSNHDDMVKYILSRFIHKIIIGNETIIVNYNYGGFYFDFKSILLLESVAYQRDEVYAFPSLKEVI
ncbi:recombinase family protein [Turicibacter sanguinis]|uniref:recombinase family protein n=1 Tax=Turicibacter sanguinis TaxID=154288 RepID=UPI001E38B753|nr:recombinase family protein [Turicibacter sanguinis]